jgi:hypothetical protein
MRLDIFNIKSHSKEWTALLCRDTDRPWRVWAERGDDSWVGWDAGVTHWWLLQFGYWTLSLDRFTASPEFDRSQAPACL